MDFFLSCWTCCWTSRLLKRFHINAQFWYLRHFLDCYHMLPVELTCLEFHLPLCLCLVSFFFYSYKITWDLKGTKIKILSVFTHHYVISKLYDCFFEGTEKIFWIISTFSPIKPATLDPIEFHFLGKKNLNIFCASHRK